MATDQINQKIELEHGEPMYSHGMWNCNIWEKAGTVNTVFATTWGKSAIEARSKANSIVNACGRDWYMP